MAEACSYCVSVKCNLQAIPKEVRISMLLQFSLNSAEARRLLAAGFWRWPVVTGAGRVILCRSTTAATLLVHRWPEFPWQSFVAGVVARDGVTVQRQPAAEAVVRDQSWVQQPLGEITDLSSDDLIIKSANAYDGQWAGVLLGHRAGFGTMGRIYPELERSGKAAGCAAKVVSPMLSEKLLPAGSLRDSGYPDLALGWPSRFLVFRPDRIFDERDALRELGANEVRIVSRGASHDGHSVTTYHVAVDDEAAPSLLAAVDAAKGAEPLAFAVGPALAGDDGDSWRDSR